MSKNQKWKITADFGKNNVKPFTVSLNLVSESFKKLALAYKKIHISTNFSQDELLDILFEGVEIIKSNIPESERETLLMDNETARNMIINRGYLNMSTQDRDTFVNLIKDHIENIQEYSVDSDGEE